MRWFELHKDINIAARPEVVSQDRPKKSQAHNVMSLAELSKLLVRYPQA